MSNDISVHRGLNPFIIAPQVCAAIDKWLTKYPPEQKRSALVPALLLVQQQNHGWLSQPAIEAVADYLGLPTIAVYEVATFYDMYELKPTGKYKIKICTNVSCLLRGAEQLVDAVEERLGIRVGDTTANGLFSLREAECMAACGGAPMCQIDDRVYHENLTPDKIIALIDELEAQSALKQAGDKKS